MSVSGAAHALDSTTSMPPKRKKPNAAQAAATARYCSRCMMGSSWEDDVPAYSTGGLTNSGMLKIGVGYRKDELEQSAREATDSELSEDQGHDDAVSRLQYLQEHSPGVAAPKQLAWASSHGCEARCTVLGCSSNPRFHCSLIQTTSENSLVVSLTGLLPLALFQ